ncbi:MAG TPA: Na+/H+ antiporter NhaA, partial [Thermoleophilaceae bacterium]|nr:Na+/H+ antiporter NhaA [Thermoleophilaceae bacterium]
AWRQDARTMASGPDALTRPFTDRTAWARNLAAPVRDFLSTESAGAVALLGAAVAALAWANSPWSDTYESFWSTTLSIRVGGESLSMDLRHWVSEGLMAFFFLVVGLEARRELDLGALRERRRITLPLIAAAGGMAVPVLIYLAINAGGDGAHGWGAAMSTDTAFALGVLAVVTRGATRLRVRLLTLVVIDDLVALVVIATVYTEEVDVVALAVAGGLFLLLLALRYAPVAWRAPAAALVGVGVWVALHESGVDPLLAGLAVGLAVSAYPPARTDLERVTEQARSFREQPTPELARSAQLSVTSAISANERLQYRLHPWTSFVIVPLFALANVGFQIDGELLGDAVTSPITLGIVFGYVVGKPVGLILATWLATRTWVTGLRPSLTWPVILGGGAVAGIPFTVSLLIAGIAFEGRQLDEAKLGVLAAAILASLLSWAVFRAIARLPAQMRARQLAATAEELLDLSDDVDPGRDHIRGPGAAPVTLLEYGDYECPHCGQAELAIRELLDEFGDELRSVWRHLPLSDVHTNAQMAAEATEAAGAQGAFWPMHDRLLASQDELTARDLKRHAADLGLDVERFWDELRRREHADRVTDDVASADTSGVAGTPSFFINGRRHHGAYDVDTLSAAVRAARARARPARAGAG